MQNEILTSVIVNPTLKATHSVIWMHGLGADGHDFANIVPELNLPKDTAIRFIFPHAPIRPVTINGGASMRAWYDILGLEANSREDEASLRASAQAIEALIAAEKADGVPSNNIILGGFSQGGAMALQCGLRYPEQLAGILALSTYLPLAKSLTLEASSANQHVPIFMAHGTFDPLLPLEWGQRSADLLKQAGYPLEFRTYPMPHSVCTDEINDIASWLKKVFSI